MADDNKSDSSVDQNLIRELAKLLDETNLTEIEIERSGLRVRVARGGGATAMTGAGATCVPPRLPRPS
jgi:acetyl-CoA carboxylase biotin carboxyl carrier protein